MAKKKRLRAGRQKPKEIEINKAMFFLPDDLKKLKRLKGRWLLYVKKGFLTKLDKNKEKRK